MAENERELCLLFSWLITFKGRRTQGRRGSSSTRGSKPRSGSAPVKFEGEFDFESSNAKFNKEEIEEELQQKLHENLRITDNVNGCIAVVTVVPGQAYSLRSY